jgi:hypothetical protein
MGVTGSASLGAHAVGGCGLLASEAVRDDCPSLLRAELSFGTSAVRGIVADPLQQSEPPRLAFRRALPPRKKVATWMTRSWSGLRKRETFVPVANEQTALVDDHFGGSISAFEIACECGRSGCAEVIALQRSVYEKARTEPRRFLLVPRPRAAADKTRAEPV